jgi:YfiH family protein
MVFIASGAVEPAGPGGRPTRWAATGRRGGVSAAPFDSLNLAGHVGDDPASVAANRESAVSALGLAPASFALLEPVHGADVVQVDSPGVASGVDGLVTTRAGLALIALGADCVPIALIGSAGRAVGVVHCGWHGLVVDVVGAAVSAMRDLDVSIGAIVLGPAVCGACYPVPAERAEEVSSRTSAAVSTAALERTADGQPGIDVRAGVRARLQELGIPLEVVSSVGGCTVEDPTLFSFRRDGRTGRQGMVAGIVGNAHEF